MALTFSRTSRTMRIRLRTVVVLSPGGLRKARMVTIIGGHGACTYMWLYEENDIRRYLGGVHRVGAGPGGTSSVDLSCRRQQAGTKKGENK